MFDIIYILFFYYTQIYEFPKSPLVMPGRVHLGEAPFILNREPGLMVWIRASCISQKPCVSTLLCDPEPLSVLESPFIPERRTKLR